MTLNDKTLSKSEHRVLGQGAMCHCNECNFTARMIHALQGVMFVYSGALVLRMQAKSYCAGNTVHQSITDQETAYLAGV